MIEKRLVPAAHESELKSSKNNSNQKETRAAFLSLLMPTLSLTPSFADVFAPRQANLDFSAGITLTRSNAHGLLWTQHCVHPFTHLNNHP